MADKLSFSFLWSRPFLTGNRLLLMLFVVNFAGTVYGYIWYEGQLIHTMQTMPLWYLPFVPDSPTASLFFTLSLLYLLFDNVSSQPLQRHSSFLRGFIEAFALITSFKYGIWAVAMIALGAAQGDPVVWQDWMLTVSHLGMAAEVLLFARFYTYRKAPIAVVAIWTLWNDYMDYVKGVYPGLPEVLKDDLGRIEVFTIALSFISIAIAVAVQRLRMKETRMK